MITEDQTLTSNAAIQSDPVRRSPKWFPIVITCASGCGLLAILFVVGLIAMFSRTSQSAKIADPAARQFIRYVSDHKDREAYAMTSSAWQQKLSLKDFARTANLWRDQQGKCMSLNLIDTRWYSGTGGSTTTLVYAIHGSKSDLQVAIVLIPENGRQLVNSYNLNFVPSGK